MTCPSFSTRRVTAAAAGCLQPDQEVTDSLSRDRYELSAEAARERQELDLAVGFSAVSIALYEVAASLEEAA